jgi:hypothetical protein
VKGLEESLGERTTERNAAVKLSKERLKLIQEVKNGDRERKIEKKNEKVRNCGEGVYLLMILIIYNTYLNFRLRPERHRCVRS